jgi:hypothetical protein
MEDRTLFNSQHLTDGRKIANIFGYSVNVLLITYILFRFRSH